ncbi:TIGR02234 family membrane protein [Gordonia terrae]|uniref:TIGR02234 family membrane protein n=1 Tax=Gordonia terrae TaxID=2055 RepID=A0A2I1RBU5_9ACTN|nr:TIGR02234 family membrane protein [Gordonia terrae]PKZ66588.1 TIGR02234 family membrane protein [Gordonia terrae]
MTSAEPGTGPDAETTRRRSVRRLQVIAALLMAAAAAAFWGASRMTWATVSAEDGLSPQRAFEVNGGDWSPWLTPLALVYLAGILAALSVRGWALRVVAILVAVGGVLAAFPAISLITGGADSDYAADAGSIPDRYVVLYVDTNTLAALLVLAGTLCAVGAAVALLRVAKGATRSSKYTTPAARREEIETEIFADYERRKATEAHSGTTPTGTAGTGAAGSGKPGSGDDADPAEPTADPTPPGANERMMWDALDTGIDPTDPTDPDRR